MSSGFLQLCSNQSHAAFPFRQTKPALYFHTFTFIQIILCLVLNLILSRSLPRAGPDNRIPRSLQVAEDFHGSGKFVCQNTAGIVSPHAHRTVLPLPAGSLPRCRRRDEQHSRRVQPSTTLMSSLAPNSTGFPAFPRTIGANKRLTDTDDTIRNAVRSVVIHVLLLLVDGSQRIQPLHLPVGQGLPKKELAVNRFQIPLEIAQLLSNGFAGHFCGVFAASCVLQVVFPGALAVGAGLLSFCRVMEHVQGASRRSLWPR